MSVGGWVGNPPRILHRTAGRCRMKGGLPTHPPTDSGPGSVVGGQVPSRQWHPSADSRDDDHDDDDDDDDGGARTPY